MRLYLACAALLISGSACSPPHVRLQAPPASAAPEARVEAYEKLAPARLRVMTVTSKRGSVTFVESIELNDGRRVHHAVDLLPVVASNSRAESAIRKAEDKKSTAKWLTYGGIVALSASMVLMVADLSKNGPKGIGVPFYLGAGIGVGGVISIPVGQVFGMQSNQHAEEAMRHYHDGLLRRLDLCEDGGGVEPCG